MESVGVKLAAVQSIVHCCTIWHQINQQRERHSKGKQREEVYRELLGSTNRGRGIDTEQIDRPR